MTLKELRKKYNLTQAALAGELGVSGKTISLIELDKLKLSEKLSGKIKEVYNEVVEPAEKTARKLPDEVKKEAKTAKKKVRAAGKKVGKAVNSVEKTVEEAAANVEKTVDAVATAAAEAALDIDKKVEKRAVKTAPKKRALNIVIQSPMGGEITAEEIRRKVGDADAVYVRVDQNKAYWVRGEETGSVDLW